MMQLFRKVLFGLMVINLTDIVTCKFYSGTFSWMQEKTNKIRFVYRMTWQKGTGPCGPGCNVSDIGKPATTLDPSLVNISVINDTTRLGDIHYTLTDVSDTDSAGWEQGESVYLITPTKNQSVVYVKDIPWIASGNNDTEDLGYLQTTIDTRVRNDTNRPNISPFASVPPYIGVQYGCKTIVRIPADDSDGDRLRCRLAQPSECQGGCTNVPTGAIYVNESSCTLTINASPGVGIKAGTFYRLAMVIEDYPDYLVSVGSDVYDRQRKLSQIPYQVTLWVTKTTIQCNLHNMTFVIATPRNFASLFLTLGDLFRNHKGVNTSFYVRTENQNSLAFIVSGPRGVQSEIISDDLGGSLNRTDVVKLNVIWKPNHRTQYGGSQTCVWGMDTSHRLTTEARCFTVFSSDYNSCSSTDCQNNSTCKNIYGDTEKCVCTPGYKGQKCSTKIQCYDNPCLHGGTCMDNLLAGYQCSCISGYSGRTCDVRDPSTTQRAIVTTPGLTISLVNNSSNSTTDLYEVGPTDTGDNNTLLWGVLGGVWGFLLLVIIAIIIYKVMKHKKQPVKVSRQRKITPSSNTEL